MINNFVEEVYSEFVLFDEHDEHEKIYIIKLDDDDQTEVRRIQGSQGFLLQTRLVNRYIGNINHSVHSVLGSKCLLIPENFTLRRSIKDNDFSNYTVAIRMHNYHKKKIDYALKKLFFTEQELKNFECIAQKNLFNKVH